jgi:hypothetical protein
MRLRTANRRRRVAHRGTPIPHFRAYFVDFEVLERRVVARFADEIITLSTPTGRFEPRSPFFSFWDPPPERQDAIFPFDRRRYMK